MRANNILGIIFANAYDNVLGGMTAPRAMGSVPFGGSYRLIDFTLSNMVNAGIDKVGVITSNNYQSLMDHLGNGKPWDLARKHDGLFFLPPFSAQELERYNSGRLGALQNNTQFLEMSNEEYVVMSDCNAVMNIDLREVFRYHLEKNADITMVYRYGSVPKLNNRLVIDKITDGRVCAMSIATADREGDANCAANITIMRKALLESLLREANASNAASFERDVLLKNVTNLRIFGYEFKEFCPIIDSIQTYFDANFALLDEKNQKQLFVRGRPIYTKVYDDMPVVYGLGSEVKNSLVADGCVIDGIVENSIVFRNCRIAKGAVVRNCVIMPSGFVADDATLANCILDKDVTVRSGRTLSGAETYPVYLAKGIRV
ncbi:MAG: glucose-1-phosphate adenylyltransferase subunit GlgD [Clostridia bacterium]|nr:glucose-1-phosphate adenylyltransferase subunit GlgD [Clostridia bacterium]